MEFTRRGMLSEVLEAIGSDKRLATLEQLTEGTPAKDVHKHIDASRSGVQHFTDDFRDVGLISPASDGTYTLTEKGQRVMEALAKLDTEFKEFEMEQLRGMAFESSLSAEEIEELLEEVKQRKEE